MEKHSLGGHVNAKMRRMLGARDGWTGIPKRFRLLQQRPFSTNNRPTIPSNNSNNNGSDKVDGSLSTYDETYRQLDKLDFMTAAKILFTTPPKKKKFGFDFHLVQFFFACMPSLAVYLVAQYARHEMRRMEAELELKKIAEEAKAKEIALNASEEKEAGSDPEILEVKVRLDKLEEAVKEIVVESKKLLVSTLNKKQEDGSEKRHHAATDNNNTLSRSETSNSAASDKSDNVAPNSMSDASQQDLKGIENGVSAKK